jgi:SAM-dependent methyltransferase
MSTGFEAPNYDTLIAEQAIVQAEKFQGRQLSEYNVYMFPGQGWREPRESAVTDFVKPFVGDGEVVCLEAILTGLCKTMPERPLSWVDMGGGRALPMRQLASASNVAPGLQMTNVDLFNYGLDGLEQTETDYLERLAPGITVPENEPTVITDNVESVILPIQADLITSVEAMQYLNNPLEALANWYNQLADNGIMMVATEHDWASWIRYQGEPNSLERDETPTKHLLEELTRNNIHFAASYESDWQDGYRPELDSSCFRIMAIQKKPETRLRVAQPVAEVWVNHYNFKAVYYEAPLHGSAIVEIVNSNQYKTLGATTLSPIG